MGDQIEMSTAENIFGSASKFLTPNFTQTYIFVQYWSCGKNT